MPRQQSCRICKISLWPICYNLEYRGNWILLKCQLRRHWWCTRLSVWQSMVSSVTAKLASLQFVVSSVHSHTGTCSLVCRHDASRKIAIWLIQAGKMGATTTSNSFPWNKFWYLSSWSKSAFFRSMISRYQSHPWPRSLRHISVTRPPCANISMS